jgi:cytochrome c6
MLRAADRILAPVTWLATAFIVLVLFLGPELIGAEKSGAAASAPVGEAVFTSTCAGCHTLQAAGATGSSGPNLDAVVPDAATVEAVVRGGQGGMPAFEGQLYDAEIAAVAEYVAAIAGGGAALPVPPYGRLAISAARE